MRLLIRKIEARNVQQSIFDGNAATIGRGTNQDIQIFDKRLPLNHSTLSVAGGKLIISAASGYKVLVNGQQSTRAELVPGDVVDIFGHNLEILAGEDTAEFVVQLQVKTEQVEEFRNRFTTRLYELGVPERKLSWFLFLVIAAIGLVIPAAGFFVGMDTLRDSPLPDDGIWLSGELHQSHAFMGDNCTNCHQKAFVQTTNQVCLDCHSSVNHHFDTDKFGFDYRGGSDCADCHKEHSTTGSITKTDQETCTVCHADLAAADFASERLRSATDFLTDHPTFRLTLQKYREDDRWHEERVDNWDENLLEESNLIFPHDVHLLENDKVSEQLKEVRLRENIEGAESTTVMLCADCHQAEKGGLNMKSVTMEKHCAYCHELTFDPSTPDRVVSHGSPPDLMRELNEYYSYQFLHSGPQNTAASRKIVTETFTMTLPETRAVRRPGRKARTQSITDLIVESSIDTSEPLTVRATRFIDARVRDAAANLFERQTCTICHDISRSADTEVPWMVKPVHLSVNWLPLSEFSHDGHKSMACISCHEDAPVSNAATDVLMPNIGSCRGCHGGQDAENLLQSTCITCHKFHMESQSPMHELLAIDLGTDKKEGEQ